MPVDTGGRDSALVNLSDPAPTVGPLYREPVDAQPVAARRRRVGRARRRLDVGARRLRPLLQHQQPAEPDRHGDQSAGDAALRHRQPDVPRRRRSSAASATRSGRCSGSSRRRGCTCGTSACSARCRPSLDRDGRLRRVARHAPVPQHRRQHPDADDRRRRPAVLRRRPAAPEPQLRHDRAEEQRRRQLVQARSSSSCGATGARASRCSRRTPGRAPRTRRRRRRSSRTRPTARRSRFPEFDPGLQQGARPTGTRAHNWVLNADLGHSVRARQDRRRRRAARRLAGDAASARCAAASR